MTNDQEIRAVALLAAALVTIGFKDHPGGRKPDQVMTTAREFVPWLTGPKVAPAPVAEAPPGAPDMFGPQANPQVWPPGPT